MFTKKKTLKKYVFNLMEYTVCIILILCYTLTETSILFCYYCNIYLKCIFSFVHINHILLDVAGTLILIITLIPIEYYAYASVARLLHKSEYLIKQINNSYLVRG